MHQDYSDLLRCATEREPRWACSPQFPLHSPKRFKKTAEKMKWTADKDLTKRLMITTTAKKEAIE